VAHGARIAFVHTTANEVNQHKQDRISRFAFSFVRAFLVFPKINNALDAKPAMSCIADLTLPLGEVVHDYLTK